MANLRPKFVRTPAPGLRAGANAIARGARTRRIAVRMVVAVVPQSLPSNVHDDDDVYVHSVDALHSATRFSTAFLDDVEALN